MIGEAPSLAMGDAEPPPGPYILAVGDLRRKKNLGRLAEAFGHLRAEGLPHRLVIAGHDAGEGERLRAAGVSSCRATCRRNNSTRSCAAPTCSSIRASTRASGS